MWCAVLLAASIVQDLRTCALQTLCIQNHFNLQYSLRKLYDLLLFFSRLLQLLASVLEGRETKARSAANACFIRRKLKCRGEKRLINLLPHSRCPLCNKRKNTQPFQTTSTCISNNAYVHTCPLPKFVNKFHQKLCYAASPFQFQRGGGGRAFSIVSQFRSIQRGEGGLILSFFLGGGWRSFSLKYQSILLAKSISNPSCKQKLQLCSSRARFRDK